jgi:hypothetical protein
VVPVIAATSCLGGVHVVGIGARWPWPQDTRCHRGQHSSTAATITIGCSCAAPAIPAPVAGDSGRIRIDPPVSRWIAPVLRDRLHFARLRCMCFLLAPPANNVSYDAADESQRIIITIKTHLFEVDSRRAHSMPCVQYSTPIRSIQHVHHFL